MIKEFSSSTPFSKQTNNLSHLRATSASSNKDIIAWVKLSASQPLVRGKCTIKLRSVAVVAAAVVGVMKVKPSYHIKSSQSIEAGTRILTNSMYLGKQGIFEASSL